MIRLLILVSLITACEIQDGYEFHCERFLSYSSAHKHKRPEVVEIYSQCRKAELSYYSGANK